MLCVVNLKKMLLSHSCNTYETTWREWFLIFPTWCGSVKCLAWLEEFKSCTLHFASFSLLCFWNAGQHLLPKARHIGMRGYMCSGRSMPYCVQRILCSSAHLSTIFMSQQNQVMKCFPSACQSMTNLWLCNVLSMLNVDCRKAVTCRVSLFPVPLTQSSKGCRDWRMWCGWFQQFDVPMLSLQSACMAIIVHQTHATIFCIPVTGQSSQVPIPALSHLNDMALKPSSRSQGLWRWHFGHDLKMSPTQWQLFGFDGFWAWHRLTFTFTMWLTWHFTYLSKVGQIIWVPNR